MRLSTLHDELLQAPSYRVVPAARVDGTRTATVWEIAGTCWNTGV